MSENKALDSREARNIRKFFAVTFLSFKKMTIDGKSFL